MINKTISIEISYALIAGPIDCYVFIVSTHFFGSRLGIDTMFDGLFSRIRVHAAASHDTEEFIDKLQAYANNP